MVSMTTQDVRLADATLGRRRHVCGLFDGTEEATTALLPFVVEGLRAGARVVHLVETPAPYLARLGAELDVDQAVSSGQFVVSTWAESYTAGGAFKASRMLAYVRRLLRESRALGFPSTRLIGDMGWAAPELPGVHELVDYETALGTILARPAVSVVCSYDVRRAEAGELPTILAAHDAVLMGGRLLNVPEHHADDPRERILAAAAVLFAEDGPSRTGVDALIEAAGVAKATFYRQFPSKDALVVAWLRDDRTRWFDRVRVTVEARAGTPAEVVPRFFEAVADWLEAEDFLGCPYLNSVAEFADPTHPAAAAIRDYLAEIGAYLEQAVAAAGYPDAGRLGRELHVLLAGAITLGAANRTTAHLLSARDAAVALLGATSSPARRPRRGSGR
jgi:AcrR family transcriptional regulator